MGTTITIGLVAWFLLAILVALVVGEMIRLRDRQRPDGTEPGESAQGMSAQGTSAQGTSADCAAAIRPPLRWWLRNKI